MSRTPIPDEPARNYFLVARQYLQFFAIGQSSLAGYALGTFDMMPPRGLLAGFAMELYLKAYLRHHGVSSEDLASKVYGHDIERLYQEALDLGLQVMPQMHTMVTVDIGPQHKGLGFRYVKSAGGYVQTNWAWIGAGLCHLDETIAPILGISDGHLVDLNALEPPSP